MLGALHEETGHEFGAPAAGASPRGRGSGSVREVSRPSPHYSALALIRARFSKPGFWRPLWIGARLREAYEVVVVGAGGHGLATAYHLARDHGIKRIAVLEKRLVGYGNVGRNTTIVRSNYLLPENHYFYEDSLKRWERLSRDLNYNVMYSPRGVLDLALSDGEMVSLSRRGNAMRLAGIDAELLDHAGVLAFAPELAASGPRRFELVGGLLQRRGGTVRHDAVAWGYARAASALGVDIIEDCEVTGVRTAAGLATGVETSRGYVKAERIVFAVAGHTGLVGRMLGMTLPIETHLLQAMVTEPIKPLIGSVLVYVHPHGEAYVTQSDRGGVVMGGFLDGFPSYTREGQWYRMEDVAQTAMALLPQIASLRVLRHWAGTNDMTMDGSFIIDRIAFDNVFLNGGWCYGGFKAIPASGAACARLVATGTAPDLIRAHTLARFRTGRMLDERGGGPFPVRL
jgi:sarcosine oxidase subunit beta